MSEKKLKKYVKKEWEVNIDIHPQETLKSLAEKIVTKREGCTVEEAWEKTIEGTKLPFWVILGFVMDFNLEEYSDDLKIEEMIKRM